MDFLSAALRASMPHKKEYPTCRYTGLWTDDEKKSFKTVGLDKYIPELEYATFNTWTFDKYVDFQGEVYFMASRATWEVGPNIQAHSAEELFAKVLEYYQK